MSEGGKLVRQWRKKRGWTQTALGSKTGMGASTISRIETGRLIPDDNDVRALARNLGQDSSALIKAFDADRGATKPAVGDLEPLALADFTANYYGMVQQLRLAGQTRFARMYVEEAIDKTRAAIARTSGEDRQKLNSSLAKLLIERAIIITQIIPPSELPSKLGRTLTEVRALFPYIERADTYSRDMARILPGMVLCLRNKWSWALSWYWNTLPLLEDPIVIGTSIHELLVLNGRRKDKEQYRKMLKFAEGIVANQVSGLAGQSLIWQGAARGANNVMYSEAAPFLQQSIIAYSQFRQSGEQRRFIEAEIALTNVEIVAVNRKLDLGQLEATIKSAKEILSGKQYPRHINEVRQALLKSDFSNVQKMAIEF